MERRPFANDKGVTPVTPEMIDRLVPGGPTSVDQITSYWSMSRVPRSSHSLFNLGTLEQDVSARRQQWFASAFAMYARITNCHFFLISAMHPRRPDECVGYYLVLLRNRNAVAAAIAAAGGDPVDAAVAVAGRQEERKGRGRGNAFQGARVQQSRAEARAKELQTRKTWTFGDFLDALLASPESWKHWPELHGVGEVHRGDDLSRLDIAEWEKVMGCITDRNDFYKAICEYSGDSELAHHSDALQEKKFSFEDCAFHPSKIFSVENAVRARYREDAQTHPRAKVTDEKSGKTEEVNIRAEHSEIRLTYSEQNLQNGTWPPVAKEAYRVPFKYTHIREFRSVDFPHLQPKIDKIDKSSRAYINFYTEHKNDQSMKDADGKVDDRKILEFYAETILSDQRGKDTLEAHKRSKRELLERLDGNPEALAQARNQMLDTFESVWNTDRGYVGAMKGFLEFEETHQRTNGNFCFSANVKYPELSTWADLASLIMEAAQSLQATATTHVHLLLALIILIDSSRDDIEETLRLAVMQCGKHGSGKSHICSEMKKMAIEGTVTEVAHKSEQSDLGQNAEAYTIIHDEIPAQQMGAEPKAMKSWELVECIRGRRSYVETGTGLAIWKQILTRREHFTQRAAFEKTADGKTRMTTVEQYAISYGNRIVNVNILPENIPPAMRDRFLVITYVPAPTASDGKTPDIITAKQIPENRRTQTSMKRRYYKRTHCLHFLSQQQNTFISMNVLDSPNLMIPDMLNHLFSANLDHRGGLSHVRGSRTFIHGQNIARAITQLEANTNCFAYGIGGPDESRAFKRSDLKKSIPLNWCNVQAGTFTLEFANRYMSSLEEQILRVLRGPILKKEFFDKAQEVFKQSIGKHFKLDMQNDIKNENKRAYFDSKMRYIVMRNFFYFMKKKDDAKSSSEISRIEFLTHKVQDHLESDIGFTAVLAALTELSKPRIKSETGGYDLEYGPQAPIIFADHDGPHEHDLRVHLDFLLVNTTKDGLAWDIIKDIFEHAETPKFKVMRAQTVQDEVVDMVDEKGKSVKKKTSIRRYDQFQIRELGVEVKDHKDHKHSNHTSASSSSSSSQPVRTFQDYQNRNVEEEGAPNTEEEEALAEEYANEQTKAAQKSKAASVTAVVFDIEEEEKKIRALQKERMITTAPNPTYKSEHQRSEMIRSGLCSWADAESYNTTTPTISIKDRTDERVALIHLRHCGIRNIPAHFAMPKNLYHCRFALYMAQKHCFDLSKQIHELLHTRRYLNPQQQSAFMTSARLVLHSTARRFCIYRLFTAMPAREWSLGRVNYWIGDRDIHMFKEDKTNPTRVISPKFSRTDVQVEAMYEYCSAAMDALKDPSHLKRMEVALTTFNAKVREYLKYNAAKANTSVRDDGRENQCLDVMDLKKKCEQHIGELKKRIEGYDADAKKNKIITPPEDRRPLYDADGNVIPDPVEDENADRKCEVIGFYDDDEDGLPELEGTEEQKEQVPASQGRPLAAASNDVKGMIVEGLDSPVNRRPAPHPPVPIQYVPVIPIPIMVAASVPPAPIQFVPALPVPIAVATPPPPPPEDDADAAIRREMEELKQASSIASIPIPEQLQRVESAPASLPSPSSPTAEEPSEPPPKQKKKKRSKKRKRSAYCDDEAGLDSNEDDTGDDDSDRNESDYEDEGDGFVDAKTNPAEHRRARLIRRKDQTQSDDENHMMVAMLTRDLRETNEDVTDLELKKEGEADDDDREFVSDVILPASDSSRDSHASPAKTSRPSPAKKRRIRRIVSDDDVAS